MIWLPLSLILARSFAHASAIRRRTYETRLSVAIFRGKIRAAEKWLQLGREPHVHRPAAAAGRGLDEGHVNAIDVGTFLAIDFDVDELSIEKAAISSFSKDSRSMTWHQWQVE